MTGGESGNEDVGGLAAADIVVEFIVVDLDTIVFHDAKIVDHEGLILHELVLGGRRGDFLDFALVFLLSEFTPEGIEGELAGGLFSLVGTFVPRVF